MYPAASSCPDIMVVGICNEDTSVHICKLRHVDLSVSVGHEKCRRVRGW